MTRDPGSWVTLVTWISGYLDGWVTLVPGYPNNGVFERYGDGDSMTQ